MRAWVLAWMVLAGGARAQALLDPAAVPYLTADGRANYAAFLATNLPRAFAVARNGSMGWAASKTAEAARSSALALCAEHGGRDCALYADGLDIVWPGREAAMPPPPGPLASTWNYDFVPDARYIWRGPGQAAGVYVWAHGTGGNDPRGTQPQPHVRAFNNAGFDVVRFDRVPMADNRDRAAGWLRDELAALRRSGYRRIVVGGQSRGGWNALQMLDNAGLADVVIAISPAAQGSGASANLTAQDDELRRVVEAAQPARSRLAFIQFAGDPFMSDADTRLRLLRSLSGRLEAVLTIDRPEGFSGHFGAQSNAFAVRFADCLLHFATDAVPATDCSVAQHRP